MGISFFVGDGFNPRWNADGRLAFVSTRDGNNEVYVWDGVNVRRITHTPNVDELRPVWMP
jgi:YD repeat-containing protein